MKRLHWLAAWILLIFGFIFAICLTAHGAPATQPTSQQRKWMQDIIDSPGAKQLHLTEIDGRFLEGLVQAVPTPPPPATAPTPTVPSGGVLVGPDGLLKNLDQFSDGRAYYLQPGEYDVGELDWKRDTAIIGIDPDHPAVLKVLGCWDSKRPAGPDPLSPRREGNFHGYAGTFTLKNVKIVARDGVDPADVIVFGTDPKASLIVDNVTHVGGLWRGSGGQTIRIHATGIGPPPRGYTDACFTSTVQNVLLDFTGLPPITQGGVFVKNGKVVPAGTPGSEPQGDAALRICNAKVCEIRNATVEEFRDDKGRVWKQAIQLRPTSGLFILRGCHAYQVDIGDIRAHYDAPRAVQEVQLIDCDFAIEPHYTPGAKIVKFVNTKIGGVNTNKTVKK